MMEMMAVNTVTAFAGPLGFGMIFNMKPRHLLTAAAGGMLDWILYYYLAAFLDGIFVPSVCAGMCSVCDHHSDPSDSRRFPLLYDEQRGEKPVGGEPRLRLGAGDVRAGTGSGYLSHVGTL